jgi:hypothetical protein
MKTALSGNFQDLNELATSRKNQQTEENELQ